jgi:hypothetical protein
VTRRRFPRLRVDGTLRIRFAGSTEPVELYDISVQGFAIWTATRAAKGEVRLFRLDVPGHEEHLLFAVTTHVGPSPPADYRGYFSGWFVESETSQAFLEAAIEQLTVDVPPGPPGFIFDI